MIQFPIWLAIIMFGVLDILTIFAIGSYIGYEIRKYKESSK